jgi:hypothetical protein
MIPEVLLAAELDGFIELVADLEGSIILDADAVAPLLSLEQDVKPPHVIATIMAAT